MRKWALAIVLTLSLVAVAQDEESGMKQTIYRSLVKVTLSHSVDEIWPADIEVTDQVFLDTRAKAEFDVSHIEGSKYVGYEDFDLSLVEEFDKDTAIIVYCSIGYRSEKIAEKLQKEGFTNVKNLYGGLTEWMNKGKTVVDSTGQETNRVHGYSSLWGKWYLDAEVVYDED